VNERHVSLTLRMSADRMTLGSRVPRTSVIDSPFAQASVTDAAN